MINTLPYHEYALPYLGYSINILYRYTLTNYSLLYISVYLFYQTFLDFTETNFHFLIDIRGFL